MRCPCCPTGAIDPRGNICDTCGVGMAVGTRAEDVSRPVHPWRRRQDQNERSGIADYAATKEDKQ